MLTNLCAKSKDLFPSQPPKYTTNFVIYTQCLYQFQLGRDSLPK